MMIEKENKIIIKRFNQLVQLLETNETYETKQHRHRLEKYLNSRKKIIKTKKKKYWIITILILFLLFLIYFYLLNDELIYNIYFFLLAIVRLILIQIHPYWDWTTLYSTPCLIANPFYNTSLTLSECDKCVNTTGIIAQSNISFVNFTKSIYLNHRPILVTDATKSWKAMQYFTLYVEHPILAEHDLCHFDANVPYRRQSGAADRLFNDFLLGNRRSFTAHWNNCEREALRVIRSYYSKPYFLPPSLGQTLMGNWFLISVSYDKMSNRLNKIPMDYGWIWLAQIQGTSIIEFRPKHPCEEICPVLESIKMNTGDLIMYSHLYEAGYKSISKETVLLAQGVD